MSVLEGLLWASLVWSVFFLYCLVDAPTLLANLRGHR